MTVDIGPIEERVAPVMNETIRALAKTKFVQDRWHRCLADKVREAAARRGLTVCGLIAFALTEYLANA
jgi:hypothetical protein